MKCPVCPSINLVMSDRQGVEIDYCPECRGVWLDRGELDKIIERSAAHESVTHQPVQQMHPSYQASQSRYDHGHRGHGHGHGHGHEHGHGHGHKPYRKKSFLEELFD